MATSLTYPRPPALVLADLLPGTRVRDAALVVGGAGLTALLAQVAIAVPPSPVPVTGQTLAVGLVGASLGMRRGTLSMLLYLLVGFFLPVYAGGGSGIELLWGASGGYLVGFIVATAAIGWMAERGGDRRVMTAFLAFAVAQVIVFAFGLVGLKLAVGQSWSWTIHNGLIVFLIGGAIKAAVGAALLPSAWRIAERRSDDR